jgi:hypothetical protein
MSVGFANAVAAGLRYNGVPVSFEPGWEARGNGFVFPNGRPQGLICHHTGDNYGAGLSILVNGRPDLDPPLCNCCTYPDGRIHIIAAQPANHAGAAAGKSLGPFAPTGLFNPRVWGKWDPGAGNGSQSIDMTRFRADIWGALTGAVLLGDDMPAGEWTTGPDTQTHKVTFPVGATVSGLVKQGWLSIDPSEDATVEVVARGNRTAAWIGHWGPEPVKANVRWWKELPDGTEGCTVKISTVKPGVAGWCLELKSM